MSIGEKKDIS